MNTYIVLNHNRHLLRTESVIAVFDSLLRAVSVAYDIARLESNDDEPLEIDYYDEAGQSVKPIHATRAVVGTRSGHAKIEVLEKELMQ